MLGSAVVGIFLSGKMKWWSRYTTGKNFLHSRFHDQLCWFIQRSSRENGGDSYRFKNRSLPRGVFRGDRREKSSRQKGSSIQSPIRSAHF